MFSRSSWVGATGTDQNAVQDRRHGVRGQRPDVQHAVQSGHRCARQTFEHPGGEPQEGPAVVHHHHEGAKSMAAVGTARSSTGISSRRPRTRSGSRLAANKLTLAPSDMPPSTACRAFR